MINNSFLYQYTEGGLLEVVDRKDSHSYIF